VDPKRWYTPCNGPPRCIGTGRPWGSISRHVTADLALLVEVERLRAKMGGREDVTPVAPRTTRVFRNEGGAWRLIHRHADPITSARSAESVIQT
jgi:ketosteroid isomerase-like protein